MVKWRPNFVDSIADHKKHTKALIEIKSFAIIFYVSVPIKFVVKQWLEKKNKSR